MKRFSQGVRVSLCVVYVLTIVGIQTFLCLVLLQAAVLAPPFAGRRFPWVLVVLTVALFVCATLWLLVPVLLTDPQDDHDRAVAARYRWLALLIEEIPIAFILELWGPFSQFWPLLLDLLAFQMMPLALAYFLEQTIMKGRSADPPAHLIVLLPPRASRHPRWMILFPARKHHKRED